MSGVATSCDLKTYSSYITINFSNEDNTSAITSGKKNYKTFVFLRKSKIEKKYYLFRNIISLINQLMIIFNNEFIEIEFAINKKNTLYLFQVRPIIKNIENNIYEFGLIMEDKDCLNLWKKDWGESFHNENYNVDSINSNSRNFNKILNLKLFLVFYIFIHIAPDTGGQKAARCRTGPIIPERGIFQECQQRDQRFRVCQNYSIGGHRYKSHSNRSQQFCVAALAFQGELSAGRHRANPDFLFGSGAGIHAVCLEQKR